MHAAFMLRLPLFIPSHSSHSFFVLCLLLWIIPWREWILSKKTFLYSPFLKYWVIAGLHSCISSIKKNLFGWSQITPSLPPPPYSQGACLTCWLSNIHNLPIHSPLHTWAFRLLHSVVMIVVALWLHDLCLTVTDIISNLLRSGLKQSVDPEVTRRLKSR